MQSEDEQGHPEVEVLGPGAETAESAIAWKGCSKNPGHPNFIPVTKFNLENLPQDHRTQANLDYIRDLSELTVKLRVSYTSLKRPESYFFSNLRGSTTPRFGSGCVSDVCRGEGPCPCLTCAESHTPCQEWYEIKIDTACHVVYNTEEARSTSVDFFFDDKKSKKEGKVKTLHGVDGSMSPAEKYDKCCFACATHDKDMAVRLERAQSDRKSTPLMRKIHRDPELTPEVGVGRSTVIISHPHGEPKHLTVGDLVGTGIWGISGSDIKLSHYEYRTDTCPGSSGAPVILLEPTPRQSTLLPHSGSYKDKNLNYNASRHSLKSLNNFCRKMLPIRPEQLEAANPTRSEFMNLLERGQTVHFITKK